MRLKSRISRRRAAVDMASLFNSGWQVPRAFSFGLQGDVSSRATPAVSQICIGEFCYSEAVEEKVVG